MRTQIRALVVCLMVSGAIRLGAANDSLQQVLARMDKAAPGFKGMTAQISYVTHTEVLNENDAETGTVTMKKVHPGEIQGKVDFTAPNQKSVTIEKRKVQEYLPKINTVQVFDLSKNGAQLDEFFLLGFGTSGTELAKDFDVMVLGDDNVKGQPAIHLKLVPKSPDARHYVQEIELWIPQQGDPYPLQEKIIEPSSDYHLVTYTDLKVNPPLPANALQLKLPAGVKIEHPGK